MSSNTLLNKLTQDKERVKSLANSTVKRKLINNKWRRLCSVDNCERMSQRYSLCARHFTKRKNQQQSRKDIAVSHQLSLHSATRESGAISNNPIDLATLSGTYTEQNTFDGYSKFLVYSKSE